MTSTAIILAAGRGSKLWPYGDSWPKAALPIANFPLIQWQVEALQSVGVERFVVVAGHLINQIRDATEGLSGVEIIQQTTPTGTADALLLALQEVEDDAFFVVYGDVLFTTESLIPLWETAQETGDYTALVEPAAKAGTQEWLCANVADGELRDILGHPREASHRLCGLYWLTRDMIPYLETNPGIMTSVEVGAMPPMESELAESLNRALQTGETIRAVTAEGLIVDIDKPWHLLDANSEMLKYLGERLSDNQMADDAIIEEGAEIDGYAVMGGGSFIGGDVKIKGNLWLGENARITDGAIIGSNVSIGSNSIVREYCRIEPGSAIGNRCIIGHCAEFGGLMMDGAYSYHYGEYWGIIGRSADLGAATVCGNLRFDDQNTIHRIKGRRELPKTGSANAVYLGDYTRTGVGAILMPGVKVGPYSIVGPGVILQQDLPNNTLLFVKQQLEQRRWGPEQYGW